MGNLNIDWAAAPVDRDYTAAALEGAQAGQAQRGISALQGIDINDPASLNTGIANLVRAGAADQASALMGLQLKRSAIQMTPQIMQALSGGGQQQQQPQGPDPTAAAQLHAQVAQDARAFSQTPPDQQPAMAAALKAKYLKLGVPEAAIDSALAHAATPGGADDLAGVHDNHATLLNGGQVAPDANMAHGGSYNWAQSLLGNPGLQTGIDFIKQYGGPDFTGRINTAREIMAPEIAAEANVRNARAQAAESGAGAATADLATVTLPNGSTMQVPRSMALELGASGALHGPTPEQQSFQTSRGSAAGGAPYENLTLKGPNGEEIPMSREEFARRARGGSLPTGPTIQGAANLEGQSKELTAESTEAGKRLTQYPVAIANGQTLLSLASTVGTGAYTDALAKAAKALPLTHSAKDYAANAGLLKQDLAGTFKAALNGLPVPRIGSEAKAITDAIPSSASPQDQVKVYAAGNLAAAQYQQAHDKFIQDWTADQSNPRDLSQAQHAWAQGPGAASLFTMPAWQGVSIGGKPAVVSHSFGGHDYVIPLYGLLGKNAKPIMVR